MLTLVVRCIWKKRWIYFVLSTWVWLLIKQSSFVPTIFWLTGKRSSKSKKKKPPNVVRSYLGWLPMEWFWSGSDLKIPVYKKKKFWKKFRINLQSLMTFFGSLTPKYWCFLVHWVWCICGDYMYVYYMELVIPVMHKLCNCEVF